MNTKKMILLLVMVVVVGVFALPNIVLYVERELLAKQEVYPEGEFPPMPLQVKDAHVNFSCKDCHYSPFAGFVFNVECMDCHGDTGNISGHGETPECRNCSICHWMGGSDIASYTDFISAGGFGMDATPFDVGGMAGHEDLILAAEKCDLMAGANEACFVCHTTATVSFTMPKREYMRFDVGRGNVTIKNEK